MDKLYIVIPAYNEESNIEQVIHDWYPVVEKVGKDSRLIIINDGSKDNTYEIMQKLKKENELTIFQPMTKENSGHGATILFGYHYAIQQGADYIFQTDSDGQTLPEEFWQFWEERDQWDMLIGHRSKREDGSLRVFVAKTLKLVIRICFGVSVTDANTPFRVMKVSTLKNYIGLIPKDYNLSNVIISVVYAKKQLAVKYIPITFRERQGGINSINIKKIMRIGRQAVKDFRVIGKTI